MKRASQILCLIGGIYAIIGMVSVIGTAIYMICLPNLIREIITLTAGDSIPAQDMEMINYFLTTYCRGFGIGLLIGSIPAGIACAIISFKSYNSATQTLLILCIVFGALASTPSLVGGILGLIALSKSQTQQQTVVY